MEAEGLSAVYIYDARETYCSQNCSDNQGNIIWYYLDYDYLKGQLRRKM